MKFKRWPEEILDPPGVVGDVVRWIGQTSGMRQPKFALAAGLTVCAALLGRAVKDWTGQRTNLYTLAVGNTSAGKNSPIAAVAKIVAALGQHKLIVGEACSASAVEAMLEAFPVRLFLLDEIGHYMSTMRTAGQSDVNLRTVIPALMKCWSCAGGVFCGKVRAKDSRGKWETPVCVAEPCVCLYGTTTPVTLFDSMGTEDFADGSIPRFLPLISFERPTYKAVPDAEVPPGLVQKLRHGLSAFGIKPHGAQNQSGKVDDYPSALAFARDPSAEAVFREFGDYTHKRMIEADKGDRLLLSWGKAVEIARRVALTVSAWRDSDDGPRAVTGIDADYGVELVKLAIGEMVASARLYVADSKVERMKKRIRQIVLAAGASGICRKDLTRKTQELTANERNAVLEDLVEGGEITEEERRGSGMKSQTVYFSNEEDIPA